MENNSSGSNTPLIIYGESGAGKTSLIANVAYRTFEGEKNNNKYLVILRFLGTTRHTSTILHALISITDQINSYFPELNVDRNEEDSAGDLFDYLLRQLAKVYVLHPTRVVVIFFDSIDQLQAADYDVTWLPREFPANTRIVFSTLPVHGGILARLRAKLYTDENTFIQVKKIDKESSILIISEWLHKQGRVLNATQIDLVKNLFSRAILYPLYIKLIFDIVKSWTSYYDPTRDIHLQSCLDIDACIGYMFARLESLHGPILFSRVCLYLTLFNNGMSEGEVEDILSIDDDVLAEVFRLHAPPRRRFPILLWIHIKMDLQEYFTTKEIDDTKVICWFHRRFFEVAQHKYRDSQPVDQLDRILYNIIDYYLETWNRFGAIF